MSKYINYKGHRYVRADNAKDEALSFLTDLEMLTNHLDKDVKRISDNIKKSISGVKSVRDSNDEEMIVKKIIALKADISSAQLKLSKIEKRYNAIQSPCFFG